jgi:hypothetical protein
LFRSEGRCVLERSGISQRKDTEPPAVKPRRIQTDPLPQFKLTHYRPTRWAPPLEARFPPHPYSDTPDGFSGVLRASRQSHTGATAGVDRPSRRRLALPSPDVRRAVVPTGATRPVREPSRGITGEPSPQPPEVAITATPCVTTARYLTQTAGTARVHWPESPKPAATRLKLATGPHQSRRGGAWGAYAARAAEIYRKSQPLTQLHLTPLSGCQTPPDRCLSCRLGKVARVADGPEILGAIPTAQEARYDVVDLSRHATAQVAPTMVPLEHPRNICPPGFREGVISGGCERGPFMVVTIASPTNQGRATWSTGGQERQVRQVRRR